MTVTGTVSNGVVILDAGQTLPNGTKVTVVVADPEPAAADEEPGPLAWLLAHAGKVTDLPPDFAYQHDHYIHGTAKRPPPTEEDSRPDPEAIAFLHQLGERRRRQKAQDAAEGRS